MNIAAASSHSDVLARMDADDVAELNRLQKEFDIIRQKDVDLVFSAFTKINEDSKVITEPPTQEQDSYGKSLSHAISLNPSIVHHPTVMMRKKIFDEVGGYRNFPCSQDADLWLRLQEVNCKFYRIGCPLLKYRVNTRSISQKNWFRQRLTWYYIFNLSVERLKTGGRDSYSLNDYNDKMQEQGVDDAKSEAKLRKSYFYLQKGQSSNRIYRLLYRVLAFLSHPILRQYVYNVKYKKKTRQIAIEQAKEDKDEDLIRKLRMKRALILKNAQQKHEVLEQLIDKMGSQSIMDTLLFVSDKQIGRCMESLAENHISRAKITEEESASKVVNYEGETERQKFISDFTAHRIQMLLAIKCLDEGIDIPNARIALLMSNGTNPREYIQRIGRVIRQAKDKPTSHIYDFVVVAPDRNDTSILLHEARRAQQIARNSINYDVVEKKFLEKGVNINAY